MAVPEFVHLHLHTEYSLLDGACRIAPLAARAAELGMRALAITDHGVMFGALAFYKACRQHGIKPILGCEVYLAAGSRHDRTPEKPYHLTLLAADNGGYRNLVRLVSLGFTEGFHSRPRVDYDALASLGGGLVCLTGCLNGPVARPLQEGRPDDARRAAARLRDLFGPDRLYVELQDQDMDLQPGLNRQLADLARGLDLPVVATNDAHYLRRDDARLHDLLLCIGTNKAVTDPDRLRFPTDQFYLKDAAEMALRFGHLPEALRNTVAVAERCHVDLPLGQLHLPEFQLPPGFAGAAAYLAHLCRERLPQKYPGAGPAAWQRLDHELDVIGRMGYAGYFLIVWDFVEFARRSGIPVGPGRGSGAGSLVAYVLGITGMDPLAHGLLFERFLNPDRVDMPDFDIDFCYERRGQVIEYVTRKYGADRVAQIITFGTMAARAAVRDVGRALGLSYGDVDRVAKAIPWGADLAEAMEKVPELQEAVAGKPRLQELLDLARRVEGMPRHASLHAAGVVVTPDALTEHVPLYRSAEGGLVTQFDMDQLKEIGLLKMDFLGLRTLTVLDRAAGWVRAQVPGFDLDRIPLDDPETYQMLSEGQTIGLFQLEAGWVADVLRQMRPAQFADIVAAISLCRPGPMEYIPDYVAAKQAGATYRHPDLEPILRDTYGVMIYQEQIMQVASRVAGFSLGQADLLRRAVGKKQRAELERYEQQFVTGAVARGYSPDLARQLYADILKFANYGFNKAHAAAYALLAYQTAYLKRHHPVEFMAATLASVMGSEGKVALYISECRRLHIGVLPPDVNASGPAFTPAGGAVRFGLAAVKNVGWGAVEEIVAARTARGPFTSLEDLLGRVEGRHLNRKAVESLVKAGALDSLGEARTMLLDRLDRALEWAQARQRLLRSGQTSLFDLEAGKGAPGPAPAAPGAGELPPGLRATYLDMEKEVLGFFLSGHPLQDREQDLRRAGAVPAAALADLPDGSRVTVGGLLAGDRRIQTRAGEPMAFLRVEDLTGSTEAVVFPRTLERARPHLQPGAVLLVRGRLQVQEEGEPKLVADEVAPLGAGPPEHTATGAPEPAPTGPVLYLRVRAAGPEDPLMQRLRAILAAHRGFARVRVKLEPSGRWLEVAPDLRVRLSAELRYRLVALLGPGAVVVRTPAKEDS